MIVVALVAIPFLGAVASTWLQPSRAGRWALAALIGEMAVLVAGLVGGTASIANLTLVAFGTELALRPAGIFAIAIGTVVVLFTIAATREEAAPAGLLMTSLLGLGGVALTAATSASAVTAALSMIVVVAAVSTALGREAAPLGARQPAQRFVTWLVLAASALALSGALDRFYGRQPGPGILGPVAALFVIGIGSALAALPLAFWLPAVASETPISAALAVGLLGAATLSLLAGDVSANPWLLDDASARLALSSAGAVAGVVSSLLALGERDPARCLAFLLSASADFALAALAATVPADPTGVVLTIGAQSLAGALGLACLGSAKGQVSGLFRRRPPLALGLGMASLSLIGLPLTAGYVGRWTVAPGLAGQHLLLLAVAALASVIGGLAVWRAFGSMFDPTLASLEPWRPLDLVAVVGAAILVVSGLFPGPVLALLSS